MTGEDRAPDHVCEVCGNWVEVLIHELVHDDPGRYLKRCRPCKEKARASDARAVSEAP